MKESQKVERVKKKKLKKKELSHQKEHTKKDLKYRFSKESNAHCGSSEDNSVFVVELIRTPVAQIQSI